MAPVPFSTQRRDRRSTSPWSATGPEVNQTSMVPMGSFSGGAPSWYSMTYKRTADQQDPNDLYSKYGAGNASLTMSQLYGVQPGQRATWDKAGLSPFQTYMQRAMRERELANAQTEMDRRRALDDLTNLEGQIGKDTDTQLALAKADEEAQGQRSLQEFANNSAQLGRAVSPGQMLQMSRRLAATSASRLSGLGATLRQMALAQRMQTAAARREVFMATQRQTVSDAEMLGTAQLYGNALAYGGGGNQQTNQQRRPGGNDWLWAREGETSSSRAYRLAHPVTSRYY